MAGRHVSRAAVSHAQHQPPEVAKKKRQDAVFFVKPLATRSTSGRTPAKRKPAGGRCFACNIPPVFRV
jgi:hypothetical protein